MSCLLTTSMLVVLSVTGDVEPDLPRISLWDGRAPIGKGRFEEGDAWITVHQAPQGNGAAVVICPGGGYSGLVTGPEGHGIAKWLNKHGITGIVLEYRLPRGRPFVPLMDAQQAIRHVRKNANRWKLQPTQIGIMGFSAGGHVAATAATLFDLDGQTGNRGQFDDCRPDFLCLVYPVITMSAHTHQGTRTNLLGSRPAEHLVDLFSCEERVTTSTPPTFLAHARDDKAVSLENSAAFYRSLQTHKVVSEFLILPSGGHGLNGYQGPMWDAWQTAVLKWLGEQQLLKSHSR